MRWCDNPRQTISDPGFYHSLYAIFPMGYNRIVADVLFTDEFEIWWQELAFEEQDSVSDVVNMLQCEGVLLGFPYCSKIKGSRHSHMRELRIQHQGRPYRVLYAFDPNRDALLLLGGDKTGNERWYETFVPIADRLYGEHLKELENL